MGGLSGTSTKRDLFLQAVGSNGDFRDPVVLFTSSGVFTGHLSSFADVAEDDILNEGEKFQKTIETEYLDDIKLFDKHEISLSGNAARVVLRDVQFVTNSGVLTKYSAVSIFVDEIVGFTRLSDTLKR